MSKLSVLFHKVFTKFADRDKDGDVDREDLLLIAKKLLKRYLTDEQIEEIIGIIRAHVIGVEALKATEAENRTTKISDVPTYSASYSAQSNISDIIVNLIYQLFGQRVPKRVINFVIEALVNLLGILQDEQEVTEPTSPV